MERVPAWEHIILRGICFVVEAYRSPACLWTASLVGTSYLRHETIFHSMFRVVGGDAETQDLIDECWHQCGNDNGSNYTRAIGPSVIRYGGGEEQQKTSATPPQTILTAAKFVVSSYTDKKAIIHNPHAERAVARTHLIWMAHQIPAFYAHTKTANVRDKCLIRSVCHTLYSK